MRGVVPSLPEAVQWIYDIAMYSVETAASATKACPVAAGTTSPPSRPQHCTRREISHRPNYIPENYDGKIYSARYHSDVLLPTEATVTPDLDPDAEKCKVWSWLIIDYISEHEMSADHINYGMFHPHPIVPEARYDNPWPPRVAQNSPLFEY